MKHTLLATTALVALTGAAAAEITISGTARIGVVTTEGAAAVAAGTVFGKGGAQTLGGHDLTTAEIATLDLMGQKTASAGVYEANEYNLTTTDATFKATSDAAQITKLDLLLANANALLLTYDSTAAAAIDTADERARVLADIAIMENLRGQITAKAASAAVAKKAEIGRAHV